MKAGHVAYEIVCAGMSDKKGKASGTGDEKYQSAFFLEESVDGDICLDSIDNRTVGKVGMIKMDVEGYEYRALLGAKKTIGKNRCKLAVCVYHKQEDIWEIPELVHAICPLYRFYLRHYSLFDNETVLYGIIDTDFN